MLCQELLLAVFWDRLLFLFYTSELFPFWRLRWLSLQLCRWLQFDSHYAIPSSSWAVISSRLISGVTFGGWNWKQVRLRLSYSKGHVQCIPSSAFTIIGTVLKESDDLVTSRHLISKITIAIFARFPEQLLKGMVPWGNPVKYSIIDCFWEMHSGFCPARFGVLICSVVLGCRNTP